MESDYIRIQEQINTMGIFTDRGFEYLVFVDHNDNKLIDYLIANYGGLYSHIGAVSIINQKSTDERLVSTAYYKKSESNWFRYATPFARALSSKDLTDFVLLDKETKLIEKLREDLALKECEHGWYDVGHISTTYE